MQSAIKLQNEYGQSDMNGKPIYSFLNN